jgi:Transposase DDE domain
VTRNLYEAEREHVRGLKETPAFKCSARLRKKVEMRFAHLKRNLNFRRLRLRGLTGAKDEFLLAAAAQNLQKLVRFLGQAPPSGAFCASMKGVQQSPPGPSWEEPRRPNSHTNQRRQSVRAENSRNRVDIRNGQIPS